MRSGKKIDKSQKEMENRKMTEESINLDGQTTLVIMLFHYFLRLLNSPSSF